MTPLGEITAIGGAVAPNGSYVIAETDTKAWLYPASGSPPTLLTTPEKDLVFAGWSTDSQPFFVKTAPDESKQILLGAFGKPPVPLGIIAVSDHAGLNRLTVPQVVGNASRFGYTAGYSRQLSTLVIASGITLR